MSSSPLPDPATWIAAFNRATDAVRVYLATITTTAERLEETGERGEGGDRTLTLDAGAEEVVVVSRFTEKMYRNARTVITEGAR